MRRGNSPSRTIHGMGDESTRRIFAGFSLVFAAMTVAIAIAAGIGNFPHGLSVLACSAVAVVITLAALPRPRAVQLAGFAVSAVLVVAAIVLMITEGSLLADLL